MKMMRVTALVAALLLCGGIALAAAVKSGPQVSQKVPGPFEPLNINGDNAGKENCLYCEFSTHPVAMVFAREVTPAVTDLVKKLDAATAKNSDAEMCSCVIFCSDDKAMPKQLEKLVKDAGVKKTILAVEKAAGPEEYAVNKEAEVTVVLYKQHIVKANFAYGKGAFTEKEADKVVAALPTILPKK
jgi:hypothetical protein